MVKYVSEFRLANVLLIETRIFVFIPLSLIAQSFAIKFHIMKFIDFIFQWE